MYIVSSNSGKNHGWRSTSSTTPVNVHRLHLNSKKNSINSWTTGKLRTVQLYIRGNDFPPLKKFQSFVTIPSPLAKFQLFWDSLFRWHNFRHFCSSTDKFQLYWVNLGQFMRKLLDNFGIFISVFLEKQWKTHVTIAISIWWTTKRKLTNWQNSHHTEHITSFMTTLLQWSGIKHLWRWINLSIPVCIQFLELKYINPGDDKAIFCVPFKTSIFYWGKKKDRFKDQL